MLIDENFVDVFFFFTKWTLKSTEMTWFDKFYFKYYLYIYTRNSEHFIYTYDFDCFYSFPNSGTQSGCWVKVKVSFDWFGRLRWAVSNLKKIVVVLCLHKWTYTLTEFSDSIILATYWVAVTEPPGEMMLSLEQTEGRILEEIQTEEWLSRSAADAKQRISRPLPCWWVKSSNVESLHSSCVEIRFRHWQVWFYYSLRACVFSWHICLWAVQCSMGKPRTHNSAGSCPQHLGLFNSWPTCPIYDMMCKCDAYSCFVTDLFQSAASTHCETCLMAQHGPTRLEEAKSPIQQCTIRD